MDSKFVKAVSVQELEKRGRMVAKISGKQIAIFLSDNKIFACNNRCPHEGYPLSEGSLTKGCILTCNWHNWKFDLTSGDTLVGGDQLRTYNTKIVGNDIHVDVSDPPAEVGINKALESLKNSFRRHEYDRMAREIARLKKAGGDPLEAVRQAIIWSYEHFEYGMTHAFAVTPDWLSLRESTCKTASEKLIPLIEAIGHMSWDSLREPQHPYTDQILPFNEQKFAAAIEDEDEDTAIALLNGALREKTHNSTLYASLQYSALAHYSGFGHSVIYVYKTQQLIEHLGAAVKAPLLKALIRNLIFARKEERLPEFKQYEPALASWIKSPPPPQEALKLEGKNVNHSLSNLVQHSRQDPTILFTNIFHQLARNMLYFDANIMNEWDKSVAKNVSWLDFSHGLTFSNAARTFCEQNPHLWPQALLQMACFSGRTAGYTDFSQNMEEWYIKDVGGFLDHAKKRLLDHANPEFIVSSHLVKVVTAVAQEVKRNPDALYIPDLIAATNRFLNSPFKRKHAKRTAFQSVEFVSKEG